MGWTNTGGGDHGGNDWIISENTTVSGNHYNIDTFQIQSGVTVTLEQGSVFEIHSENVDIDGDIDGFRKGYLGGYNNDNINGKGPGGGEGRDESGYDAGGGGYGSNGGDADGAGGHAYGSATSCIAQMGSGGGLGDTPDGGNGGGCVLFYTDDFDNSATIDMNGEDGDEFGDEGGGGGAGGGILVSCDDFVNTGTITATGGVGGNVAGDGGGGRIKIFYASSYTNDGTLDSGSGTTNTDEIGLCNSTYSFGQTFKKSTGLPVMISSVTFKVLDISTSGDFVLKIWESTSKTTEVASTTATVDFIGDNTWTFSDFVVLDPDTQYYMELNPSGSADIKLAVDAYSDNLGGSYYCGDYELDGYDIYMAVDGFSHVVNPNILNTDDLDVVQEIANTMLIGSTYRVNADGSGHIDYNDNFSTEKYLADAYDYSNVTRDSSNNELDINDGGYIYYKVDTRYPIQGIPVLDAKIDITSGEPTIQISDDGSTWYEIDDEIVDDELSTYDLNNQDNLQLAGLTVFYLRIDCTASGTNTCTVKYLILDIDITTIDAENPLIKTDKINEFKLEQSENSSMECTVDLIYNDRKWA